MLGVTEPAVTQYKLKRADNPKRSRGDQVEIPKKLRPELEKTADAIIETWEIHQNESDIYEILTREFNKLIKILRDAGVLCKVHRDHSPNVKHECKACNGE